ncbi:MAG: 16S rRNA (cytosine(967)-C(5))-methyltransferase RsmB [Clostridia bacterium]|nr:16S rRNA (cytosine(967)-C(5))-methyltransferase RsmB [Clostridia bacterium]
MPESPRKRAVKMLMNIDKNDAFINIEMNKLRAENVFNDVDLRFIGQLVNGVVKHRLTIDYVISKHSDVRLNKIAPFVLSVLRCGVYQILYMDKIPVSAAVNECVKIIKKSSVSRLSGYVNAVLRAVSINDIQSINCKSAEGMSIALSFPLWLINRWIGFFGVDFTRELATALNKKSDLCIRRKIDIDCETIISHLESDGVKAFPVKFDFMPDFDYCFNVGNIGDLNSLKTFRNNEFYIQDPAASLASYLLFPKSGDTVIDMCAAPGGKSLFMAEIMGNKGRIIACDIYAHKLKLINDNCDRYGIDIVEPVLSDATVLKEEYIDFADKILCDVPCSGFGIIRKKPDIKYSRTEDDIYSLAKLGTSILNNASFYLKDGGTLVYSTCTIDPVENENVIENFLEYHDEFSPYPFDGDIYYKTFYPHIDSTDGFFVCRLKKEREIK